MNLFELFVKVGVKDEASSALSNITGKLGNGLKTAAKVGVAAVSAASAGIVALTKQAVESYAEYEQLVGGAQKIFDQIDYSKIANDANNAYKELGLSANQYLAVINDVGATFAATMGDEAGYEAAKTGLKAISDYASGTGKNVDELSQKFTLITRSTSSYQSIADQFSGILPATSAAFLEQAQSAGILSDSYEQLTDVPIAEYQAAVSQMLQQGVTDLGLANNTMNEAFSTLSGSLTMAKGAWSNLVTGLADDSADLDKLIGNFVESVGAVATNLLPKIGTALNGASKLVGKIVPEIINMIPEIINENLPVILESALGIIEALVSGLSDNSEMLADSAILVLTTLATALLENLPQLITATIEMVSALANGLSEQLPTLVPVAIDAIVTIVGALLENLPLLLEAGVSLISGLIEGIVSYFEPLIETATETFNQFKDTIKNKVSEMVEQGKNTVSEFISGIKNKFAELVRAGTEVFRKVRDAVKNKVGEISTQGKDLITSFVSGVKSLFSRLTNVGSEIISTVKSAISSRVSEFFSIGSNIVEGVWQGIQNAIGWFTSSVSSFFSGIVDSVKSTLGIASPSKVFAQIGRFMAEGLGVGWDKEIGNVQKDIENSLDFGEGYIATYGVGGNFDNTNASLSRNINITQNIYAQKKSAAQLMQEARWQAQMGVLAVV